MTADPTDYRRASRRRWGRAAPGWHRRREAHRLATMPVSAWMVDALDLQPGQTVLELAAGTGETGFLAAELIRPGGTLICSDFAPEMLTAAQQVAAEQGLDNVRFKQIDAESIDQPAASLDGVLCRNGYMLMADPEAALRETRRVLKPGARVALSAWTAAEDNPWSSEAADELIARGLTPPRDSSVPGQFAWADEGIVGGYLEGAGFVDFEVDTVDFAIPYADFEEWWGTLMDMSRAFADVVEGLDEETREEVRTGLRARSGRFVVAGRGLAMPARTWVAAAVG